jgi:glycosyltransferase involved in cell wall biosynthesis
MKRNSISKICFLGNFPPKECGIATFTQDLVSSMNKRFNPQVKSRVIALNDDAQMYNYDSRVVFQVNKDDINDYISTAKKINQNKNVKLICIQHEFGIFGGENGDHLIPFLELIEKPIVVTFHSVLPDPDVARKRIVQFICDKASAVIVMANRAIEILHEHYGVGKEKLHLVYHGIPTVPFQKNDYFKRKLKLEGKTVLLTFGLMDRGKGIEYAIRALPVLIKKFPNLLYLIIGETHPKVREEEGEEYRNELIEEVEKLGLKEHVKFYNKYLTIDEITNYLLASDVYLCTNLERNQIVSGTLSYAMGCGRASVSTPIAYAKEVLNNERGIVIESTETEEAYEEALDTLLSDPELKSRIERNAYSFSRMMTWSNVASRYLRIFNKVVELRKEMTEKYPYIKLNHLMTLTDDCGVVQFSKHSVPDKDSGYTLDDNSRALITAILHNKLFNSQNSLNLAKTYLKFLENAQEENGNFRNGQGNENINAYSEDSFGRAIWSLGFTINKTNNLGLREKAKILFDKADDLIEGISSPRAKAFLLIGLSYYYKQHFDSKILLKIRKIADSLVELYEKQSSDDWTWFEPYVTYSNAKLPEALFLTYEITQNKKYLEVAEKTLKFLSELLIDDEQLSLIGHNGWFNRGGERALFDQQPIDACAMVHAYLTAYLITKDKEHYGNAVLSFNWFLGKNHIKQMVYDESTGGCFDGLNHNSVNLNQGAESTIAYLMSRLYLEEMKKEKPKKEFN